MPKVTVEQFWKVIDEVQHGNIEIQDRLKAAYLTMYTTGTTVGPYLRMTRKHLRKEHLLVHVPDTKNAERDR